MVFIKGHVTEKNPELEKLPYNPEDVKDALIEAIREAWEAMPDEKLAALVASMPKRIEAVIQAGGWQTKY
jgi:hypothetical protein